MSLTTFTADTLPKLEAAATAYRDYCIKNIPGKPDQGAGVVSYATVEPETPATLYSRAFEPLDGPPQSNHSKMVFEAITQDLTAIFLDIHDQVAARAPVLSSRFLAWNMVLARRGGPVEVHISLGPFAMVNREGSKDDPYPDAAIGALTALNRAACLLQDLPAGMRGHPFKEKTIYASNWRDAQKIEAVLRGRPIPSMENA
jgi:hypothetical protein